MMREERMKSVPSIYFPPGVLPLTAVICCNQIIPPTLYISGSLLESVLFNVNFFGRWAGH